MKKRDSGVPGRLLLKLVRGVSTEVLCWRIAVRGGVFLLSGSVFEVAWKQHDVDVWCLNMEFDGICTIRESIVGM